jgi:excisionase family DNA binding protein
MNPAPGLDLLTMREAAELLKVSEVTVARWLKQGRLPAYRVGPRAVRLRREDVERMIEPLAAAESAELPEGVEDWKTEAFRPLTEEERERGLRWLQRVIEISDEILARRGGKPFEVSSEEIIRREREKRTKQIDEAIWGRRKQQKTTTAIGDASTKHEQE